MNIKRKRFEKVASSRVQKIIHYISLLSNCSNKNNYEYYEKDVETMYKEIYKAIKESKIIFGKELNKHNKKEFKF